MTTRRWLITILLVALALRLGCALAQDDALRYNDTSGDSGWYLAHGYALVTGRDPGGIPIELATLSTPPLYLIFIGVPQAFLPLEQALVVIRALQCLLGALTCWFAYQLALRLTGNERAGLIAAGALALSPAFVLESAQILTETLYIALVTAGLWVYTEVVSSQSSVLSRQFSVVSPERSARRPLALSAILFGLATLTRAVLLAFPLMLALHLVIVCGRRGLGKAALLLLVYGLVVSTWTVYNLARWNRLVIGGQGLPAFLYIGATGWGAAAEVDDRLENSGGDSLARDAGSAERQAAYVEGAAGAILGDPLGYARRRVGELAGAVLQPHNTVLFPGESLRALALAWWHEDRSLGGLVTLTQGDAFWQKASLYVFHFGTLILGIVGMWKARRHWRVALPLAGFIAYTLGIHLFLLALPRYLFPTMVVWTVFASRVFSDQPSLVRKEMLSAEFTRSQGNELS